MSQIHIESDGERASVLLDGKDISQQLNGYTVTEEAYGRTVVTLEYACFEQLTIDGEAEIVHVCPKKAR